MKRAHEPSSNAKDAKGEKLEEFRTFMKTISGQTFFPAPANDTSIGYIEGDLFVCGQCGMVRLLRWANPGLEFPMHSIQNVVMALEGVDETLKSKGQTTKMVAIHGDPNTYKISADFRTKYQITFERSSNPNSQ